MVDNKLHFVGEQLLAMLIIIIALQQIFFWQNNFKAEPLNNADNLLISKDNELSAAAIDKLEQRFLLSVIANASESEESWLIAHLGEKRGLAASTGDYQLSYNGKLITIDDLYQLLKAQKNISVTIKAANELWQVEVEDDR